jgi:hypothetical protein
VQDSAMGNEAETYSETEALPLSGMSAWRPGSFAVSSGGGFAHRTLNDEESEKPLFLIIFYHCLSRGKG